MTGAAFSQCYGVQVMQTDEGNMASARQPGAGVQTACPFVELQLRVLSSEECYPEELLGEFAFSGRNAYALIPALFLNAWSLD